MKTINPYTGKIFKEYQEHSIEEAKQLVEKSHNAFLFWELTALKSRSLILKKVAKELERDREKLSRLISEEMGKLLHEARNEVTKCAWVCRYYAENGKKFLADIPIETDFKKSFISFRPLGCILAIMPWNYPLWQVFRFASPALMAGNAVVLKHASNVSGCALAIEDLFRKAGLPEYVFRTLLVDNKKVSSLIEHPMIQAITLTGSTQAGRSVAAKAGACLKKTVLELGGADAYLVLEDANLESVVKICAEGRLSNSGQSCISPKRLIVHERILKEFTSRLVEKFKEKTMGDPLDPKTNLAPMARKDLRDELHEQVQKSIERGANCLLGGRIPKGPGAFYPPTVLANVEKGMPAFDEELFGPVASIITASSIDHGIKLANDSNFGLGGGVFTSNLEIGERIAFKKMNSGSCFVNELVHSDPRLPFGGVKNSGYGRELSFFGIREFVNIKTICLKDV